MRNVLQSTSCFNAHVMVILFKTEHRWQGSHRGYLFFFFGTSSYHMSSSEEYSVAPSKASGGRYQSVTTSEEYVWLGMDLARARPVQRGQRQHSLSWVFWGGMVTHCMGESKRQSRQHEGQHATGGVPSEAPGSPGVCVYCIKKSS